MANLHSGGEKLSGPLYLTARLLSPPGETPGVRQQFSNGVINLGLESIDQEIGSMSDKDIEEHITGLIMIHQYTLKKGLNSMETRPRRLR